MSNLLCLLLIFLLVIACSNLVLCHSVVKSLPGFEGPLPFELETGYVGVDESEDVQLFYYFVKSESNPKEDPLVLWLTGGPGCSGFSAFIYELGPLNFEVKQNDGSLPTLVLNPNSWSKVDRIQGNQILSNNWPVLQEFVWLHVHISVGDEFLFVN